MFNEKELIKAIGARPGMDYAREDLLENRVQLNLYGCSNEQILKAIDYCEKTEVSYWLTVKNDRKEGLRRRVFVFQTPIKPIVLTREQIKEAVLTHAPKKRKSKA